jgi:hypothetical protein
MHCANPPLELATVACGGNLICEDVAVPVGNLIRLASEAESREVSVS